MSTLRKLQITLGAANTFSANGTPLDLEIFESPGTKLTNKEADYPFEIALDGGDWIPFDLAMSLEADPGTAGWKTIRVRNLGPGVSKLVFLVGDMRVTDGRLNISESRNGAAASYTPPNVIEAIAAAETLSGGGVNLAFTKLLPYDANREEVWLTTNATTAAYYGFADTATRTPARNLVPLTGEGRWTKLRTKSELWVAHTESGKTVTALAFCY